MLEKEERISSKEDLREWLSYERKSYGLGGGVKRFLSALLRLGEKDTIFRYQTLLRKYEYHLNAGHKLRKAIYHIKVKRMENAYGLHISPNTCSKGLRIMHLGSILINGDAHVGKDCRFHINTALVAGGRNGDAPYLGDDIVLGVGSTILGNVKIASGVAIGAGAVVNKDVLEEGIAVAGVPAHKISNNGTATWNSNKTPRKR